jgi:hypothetical protein
MDFPSLDGLAENPKIDENVLRNTTWQMSVRHLHDPPTDQLGFAFRAI